MGAIFFYIFIYFLGYYATAALNSFTVRPWITNRFMAALVPVFAVGLVHAYTIVASPPPQSQDITVLSAIVNYIIFPIVMVVIGAIYFMWQHKNKAEDEAQ